MFSISIILVFYYVDFFVVYYNFVGEKIGNIEGIPAFKIEDWLMWKM